MPNQEELSFYWKHTHSCGIAIIVHHALLLFFIRLDKIGFVDIPLLYGTAQCTKYPHQGQST
jgi:hypothetical protein